MKVVFVAGFLNSHLWELAEQLNKKYEFHFITTEYHAPVEGHDFGRSAMQMPYVIPYYEDDQKALCRQLVRDCDFAIFASNSAELMHIRMAQGGLSFFYSERFFKKGRLRGLHPKHVLSICKNVVRYGKRDDFYVLCASAYLPYDLTLYGFDTSKCLKWGYFPPVYRYDAPEALLQKKKKRSILWCGRMLQLKHPEAALQVAKKLQNAGYDFSLTFVGDGPQRQMLQKLCAEWALEDCVTFAGSKTPEEVRRYMEESELFLFTSNRREGWGAVLNESMNSACGVVASSAIGSVPFVIENKENGLIYQDGDVEDLYRKVVFLLENQAEREKIQKNACRTITEVWSAKNAADHLERLADALLHNQEKPAFDGPCSPAAVLKDGWYKGEK